MIEDDLYRSTGMHVLRRNARGSIFAIVFPRHISIPGDLREDYLTVTKAIGYTFIVFR